MYRSVGFQGQCMRSSLSCKFAQHSLVVLTDVLGKPAVLFPKARGVFLDCLALQNGTDTLYETK